MLARRHPCGSRKRERLARRARSSQAAPACHLTLAPPAPPRPPHRTAFPPSAPTRPRPSSSASWAPRWACCSGTLSASPSPPPRWARWDCFSAFSFCLAFPCSAAGSLAHPPAWYVPAACRRRRCERAALADAASLRCLPLFRRLPPALPPPQVHRATLHSGEQVVVKVQRPGLRQLFEIDLQVGRCQSNCK